MAFYPIMNRRNKLDSELGLYLCNFVTCPQAALVFHPDKNELSGTLVQNKRRLSSVMGGVEEGPRPAGEEGEG